MTLFKNLKYGFAFLPLFLLLLFSCQKQKPQTSQRLAPHRALLQITHKKGILDFLALSEHRLLSIGRDSLLILWQIDSAKALAFKKLNALPDRLGSLPGANGFWVFLKNGQALQFLAKDLKLKTTVSLPKKEVTDLAPFFPQKSFYLKNGSNLLLFEPNQLQSRLLPFKLAPKDGFSVHRQQPLMTVFTKNKVQLFDLRNLKQLGALTLPKARGTATEQRFIRFINSELCLAAQGENIWLINWAANRAELLPKSHLAPITALTVSNVKGIGVSGSMDKSVKIWDLKTRELRASLYGHFFNITRLAIIDSLKWLISASEDGTILLYDLNGFQILKRLGSVEIALRSPWRLKIYSVRKARAFKVGENEYNVSGSGTSLLKVKAEIKNISETEAMFFSSNFFLIDTSGARSPMVGLENYVALDPDAYFKKKLAPGQSLKGNFVFIINQPPENYRITYETLPPLSLSNF